VGGGQTGGIGEVGGGGESSRDGRGVSGGGAHATYAVTRGASLSGRWAAPGELQRPELTVLPLHTDALHRCSHQRDELWGEHALLGLAICNSAGLGWMGSHWGRESQGRPRTLFRDAASHRDAHARDWGWGWGWGQAEGKHTQRS
jgi:hypothetical protein